MIVVQPFNLKRTQRYFARGTRLTEADLTESELEFALELGLIMEEIKPESEPEPEQAKPVPRRASRRKKEG